LGDGEQTRDFVSVRDVARANVLAATKPDIASGVANICTGKPTSLIQLAEILGRKFPKTPAPKFAAARPGDVRHSLGSPRRAQEELGFVAQCSLQEGLAELARSPARR
jgi:nucleoside-diphosphate-sugar epimerase